MTKKVYDPCYKIDSKGKLRIWYMEQDGDRYRTYDGISGGKVKTSEWRTAEPTNVGRSNERNGVEQATFEIESDYEYQLTREYHRTVEETANGAHFFKPMLAEKYKKFEPGYAQPKLDGMRCTINKKGMFSREGKPILTCPHIFAELKPLVDKGHIFDGELYNHEFKEDFDAIMSLVRGDDPLPEHERAKVQYYMYDLPTDPTKSFEERFLALTETVPDSPSLILVPTEYVETQEAYDALHGQWLEEGYEGSIWRDGNAPYANKRSKALLKRKEFIDEEFPCIRIEEGKGNWSGLAKKVVCTLPDGREFKAGIKGNKVRAKTLLHEKHKVVTVRYFRLTPDGIPRFGIATKFHGEKREF
jgi:DNA ligase-1